MKEEKEAETTGLDKFGRRIFEMEGLEMCSFCMPIQKKTMKKKSLLDFDLGFC